MEVVVATTHTHFECLRNSSDVALSVQIAVEIKGQGLKICDDFINVFTARKNLDKTLTPKLATIREFKN